MQEPLEPRDPLVAFETDTDVPTEVRPQVALGIAQFFRQVAEAPDRARPKAHYQMGRERIDRPGRARLCADHLFNRPPGRGELALRRLRLQQAVAQRGAAPATSLSSSTRPHNSSTTGPSPARAPTAVNLMTNGLAPGCASITIGRVCMPPTEARRKSRASSPCASA